MTAVVSRERARATYLTGAAGVLMLAGAFVMMVVAAPGHAHGPASPPAVQLTTDVGHQLTSRSDSARVRGIKQSKDWKVEQLPGGLHRWTAPSGRQYTKGPKEYPI